MNNLNSMGKKPLNPEIDANLQEILICQNSLNIISKIKNTSDTAQCLHEIIEECEKKCEKYFSCSNIANANDLLKDLE